MRIKKRFLFAAVLSGLLCLLASFSVWHQSHFEPHPVLLPDDFEQQILRAESDLKVPSEIQKDFVWAHSKKDPTPYALVQLHGFSATRREISPVGEKIAEQMGANLFMTRLSGHGLGSEGMSSLTGLSLLQDAEEAMAVGRRMGRQVILLGTSTGAPLALHLAQKYPEDVASLILISPNFRPAATAALLLKGPVGGWLSGWMGTHSWRTTTPDEKKFWTTSYPLTAVHEMMDLLSWTDRFDLARFKTPALVFYSDNDNVVSTELILEKMGVYGGPHELEMIKGADHVLAGAIRGPKNTDFVVHRAVKFLQQNLLAK